MTPIALGTGRTALSVTAGADHACAVRDDRQLRCWGNNRAGLLGVGRGVSALGAVSDEMGDALPPVDLTGTGHGVAGIVTDAATGEPVPAALVAALAAPDYAPVGTGVTDALGRFGIDVPPGGYVVYAAAGAGSGFHGAPSAVTVTSDGYPSADAALRTGRGVIRGSALDATTRALVPGAWLLATNRATGDPERGTTQAGAGFRLDGLAPGAHHLVALDPTGAHAPRAHPSAPGPAGSVPVTVAADATTNADVTLPAVTPPSTSELLGGRVDLVGGPAQGEVWVLVFRAADLAFVRGVITEDDGRWSVGVPPGSYKVAVVDPAGALPMEWYDDQGPGGAATATSVTAPRSDVRAALTPTTGAVSGTVTRAGVPWAQVWVAAVGPHGVAGTALSRGSLGYRIDGLPPGNYRLAVVEPPGIRTEYWLDQPTYALAGTLAVTAGGTVAANADLASPPSGEGAQLTRARTSAAEAAPSKMTSPCRRAMQRSALST